jgi:carnitine O-acetyltransferase
MLPFRSSLCPLTIYGRRAMSFKQPTRVRPIDWKTAAPEPLSALTFRGQSKLPKLPVPDFNDTILRLKESLKPIAWSDIEYTSVVKKVDDFATNLGPILHSRLLERAKQGSHWLEEWWDDTGYLGYRDSVRESSVSRLFYIIYL